MALWTADQLAKVRAVIARHHAAITIAIFGHKALPDDLVKDLRASGIPVPTGPQLIDDAFTYGQLVALLRDPKLATKSPAEIAELVAARKIPLQLTPSEKAAVEVARTHAGQYVVGLGTRVAGQVMAAVTGAEANLTPERMVEIIQDKTAGNLARRETIDSLRSDLGHAMGNWTRDWQRIAMTESNNAIQEGTAATIEKEHGVDELVSKMPRPDACPDCKRLYLRGGEPIIFKLSELRANGSNVGRKKRDWKPTIEAVHPWCGCVLVRIPAGMVWEDGELVVDKAEKSQAGIEMPARPAFQYPLRKAARKLHGRLTFAGMPISIENRRGSFRHWFDPVAKEHGKTKVLFPYGYIRLTEAADGDHVDVYVGPLKTAPNVYVVHQRKKKPDGSFGGYDEDKAMLGFPSASAAKRAYLAHYSDPRFFGAMTTMTVAEFKVKLVENRGRKITKAWREPTALVIDMLAKSYAPCVRCGEMSKESSSDGAEPCWTCRKALEAAGTPYVRAGWKDGVELAKAGGPYIGPKGGKWADPEHTVAWQEPGGVESLPHLEDEKWDDGTVVRWRQSPFVHAPPRSKPQLPSSTPTSIEHVPLDKLHATQKRVTEGGVQKYLDKPLNAAADDKLDLPLVTVDKDGKHFIQDGHHRLTAAKLRGEASVPVRVQREKAEEKKTHEPLAPDYEPKVGDEHAIPGPHGMAAFTARIEHVGDDHVRISQNHGDERRGTGAHGTRVPKAAVSHFVNDLRGVVHGPPSSDPRVQAVLDGKAEHLGKGDDGIAFRVGDTVVKASTTVPYQPFNENYLTPATAAERMVEQVNTSNAMHADGVPGIMRSELVHNGDKAFQIKPYVEIPDKLTREQLDSVADSVLKAHAAGYTFNDEIQVGVHEGKLVHFDTGKAAKAPDEKRLKERAEDDEERLKDLFAKHGEKFQTTKEKHNPLIEWEEMASRDPKKMTDAERSKHASLLWMHSLKVKSFRDRADPVDKDFYDVVYNNQEIEDAINRFKSPIREAIDVLKSAFDSMSAGESIEQLGRSTSRLGMMSWRGNEDSPRPERPADIVGITDDMGLTVKGRKKRKKKHAEDKADARRSRLSPADRFAAAKRMPKKDAVKPLAPDALKEAREQSRDAVEAKRERIRDDLARRQANKPPMDPIRIARAKGES